MKKYILMLALVILCLYLVACNVGMGQGNKLKIGLAIGISGIDDKSYNQLAWESILRYAEESKLPAANYSYVNATTEKDYLINLSNYADQKMDLIIAAGYFYQESMEVISEKYPDQKCVLLDSVCESKNVSSILFGANEGSFLVGIAAALKADSMNWDKVGYIGGVDIPALQSFEAGYIEGVHIINRDIEVVVRYAEGYSNPNKGQKMASDMYDEGINIIYNVAGATGSGIIKEAVNRAKEGQDVWVIGVDRDQYEDGIYEENKSCVLTSMLKRVDVAVYDAIKLVDENKFEGGTKIYNLKLNGVGIPSTNPNLEENWAKQISAYKDEVISGNIEVPTIPDRIKQKN